MRNKKRMTHLVIAAILILASVPLSAGEEIAEKSTGKPLKVYILVGQSNMQGHAQASTLQSLALDPESKALYGKLVDKNGKPRVHKNVSIAGVSQNGPWGGPWVPKTKHGELTVGYGSGLTSETELGPELGFGVTMQELVNEPILLIKTSWGGRSLLQDFRSPSAGDLPLGEGQEEKMKKAGTYDKQMVARRKKTGLHYRMMMEYVKTVLADPGKYSKAYDPKQGVEVAGFVWFQGFNDMVGPYPKVDPKKGKKSKTDYSEYSRLLAIFIRDVRTELKAPKMPFVIGVIGLGGNPDKPDTFREAMAAPADMPEFKGNVIAVHTAKYWDEKLVAALTKSKKLRPIKDIAYRWTEDGTIDKEKIITPGWQSIGTPALEERQWRFTSFNLDDKKHYRTLKKGEAGDERTFTAETPAELRGWNQPGFDDSKWQQGFAPVGKGVWKTGGRRNSPVSLSKNRSEWGDGNVLLMRSSFELNAMDYEEYRLCIMASQSYHLYLNGHELRSYVWYRKDNIYRAFSLSKEQAGYLKKGTNVLAIYANTTDFKGKIRNSVDLRLEGLNKEGKANLAKIYEGIFPEKEHILLKGASNQDYHYYGSGKIVSRIGEAFAEAIATLEKAE